MLLLTFTRAFNEFLYEFLLFFLISENSLKFANFFSWGNEFSIYAAGAVNRSSVSVTARFLWLQRGRVTVWFPQNTDASSLLTFRRQTASHLFDQSFGWQKSGAVPLLDSRSFKVTTFGTNRTPYVDFLLVITTDLNAVSHYFQDIAEFAVNRGEGVSV